MYIKGVSTRQAEGVMREFGIESLSSTRVSRATKLLDGELAAWRNRPLDPMKYLILDAHCEKARHDGVVRDVAMLSAIGVGLDERRHVPGLSVGTLRGRGALARVPGKPASPWPAWHDLHRLG